MTKQNLLDPIKKLIYLESLGDPISRRKLVTIRALLQSKPSTGSLFEWIRTSTPQLITEEMDLSRYSILTEGSSVLILDSEDLDNCISLDIHDNRPMILSEAIEPFERNLDASNLTVLEARELLSFFAELNTRDISDLENKLTLNGLSVICSKLLYEVDRRMNSAPYWSIPSSDIKRNIDACKSLSVNYQNSICLMESWHESDGVDISSEYRKLIALGFKLSKLVMERLDIQKVPDIDPAMVLDGVDPELYSNLLDRDCENDYVARNDIIQSILDIGRAKRASY